MKKNKRLVSVLVTLTMLLSMTVMFPCTASAYTASEQETVAKALKTLNLFEGYSATDFGLKDIPTREQALIFQIRALGEDSVAKAWTGASPFADVPSNHWALPYIGYGVKMGYTTGIGNGQFGLGQPANAQMMTTFVLRGLGYTDTGAAPDFTYANSLAFGKSKELLDSAVAPAKFTRGDAASVLFNALGVKVKGTNDDLAVKLTKKGLFTKEQLDAAIAILDGKAPTTPVVTPPTTPVTPPTTPVVTPPTPPTPPVSQDVVTDKEITFTNKTGQTLTAFYASSAANKDWGENLLDGKLANGASVVIIFPVAKDDKIFDVRTDYKDTYFEFTNIDFSKFKTKGEKVVLTIKNGEGIMTQQ